VTAGRAFASPCQPPPNAVLLNVYTQRTRLHIVRGARKLERQNITSGTSWEALAGYSRAVRIGSHIFISGTSAHDAHGNLQHEDDAYAQTIYILSKISSVLEQAGASLSDVVRTRVYVVRMEDWQAVARAHGEVFGEVRPANTLVQVAGLVAGPLVEIEAEAIVQD
jgi:enamine deaminase RidA (YjgF/YER057c/UK114 family)